MMASAPTFFTKAESTVTTATRTASCNLTLLISGRKRCTAACIRPERATPALTTNALPTMMTMSSLKPENA